MNHRVMQKSNTEFEDTLGRVLPLAKVCDLISLQILYLKMGWYLACSFVMIQWHNKGERPITWLLQSNAAFPLQGQPMFKHLL